MQSLLKTLIINIAHYQSNKNTNSCAQKPHVPSGKRDMRNNIRQKKQNKDIKISTKMETSYQIIKQDETMESLHPDCDLT